MKTVAFTTLGCRVNQYDTDAMKGLFLQNNYEAVDFDEKADIYVINTCSVTNMRGKEIPSIDSQSEASKRRCLCDCNWLLCSA